MKPGYVFAWGMVFVDALVASIYLVAGNYDAAQVYVLFPILIILTMIYFEVQR